MPTYEYTCTGGHSFEEFQSIKDEPIAVCPMCGSEATRQIGTGLGLMFKGSGFYITDYKKSESPSDGNGKSDSKKDSPK